MTLLVAFVSILVITQIAWFIKKSWHKRGQRVSGWFCPICIGVSLTWIGLFGAYLFEYPVDLEVLALMLGGSVVGISYKVKELWPPTREVLRWRFIFIPIGFVAAYFFLNRSWEEFGVSLVAVGILTLALLKRTKVAARGTGEPRLDEARREALEEQMNKCC